MGDTEAPVEDSEGQNGTIEEDSPIEKGAAKKKRKKQFQDAQDKKIKTTKKKKDQPCIFYPKGNCKFGSDCRFNHDTPKKEEKVKSKPVIVKEEDATAPLVDNGKAYAPPQVPQKVLDLFSEKITEYASDLVQKKIAFQDADLKDLQPFLQQIQVPKAEELEGAKRSPEEYIDAVNKSWATRWGLLRKILAHWDKNPGQIPTDAEGEPLFTVDAVRDIRTAQKILAKKRKKKLTVAKKKTKTKQQAAESLKPKKKKKKKKNQSTKSTANTALTRTHSPATTSPSSRPPSRAVPAPNSSAKNRPRSPSSPGYPR